MKKLLKIIPALVFAACCFMFAAKCLNAGGFTGAIADFPTAIHRAVKGADADHNRLFKRRTDRVR